jgi:hypothetical protein
MPDYCFNSLEVDGDEERLNEFLEAIEGKDSQLDFNKLVPEPENLSDEDWHDWHMKHWGTKWPAEGVRIDQVFTTAYIEFDTALGSPDPIIDRMAQMFPDLEFNLTYRQPSWPFHGTVHCWDGKCEHYRVQPQGNRSWVTRYDRMLPFEEQG